MIGHIKRSLLAVKVKRVTTSDSQCGIPKKREGHTTSN